MSSASHANSLKNPKVSVAMITYNHEKFIGQAVESVLMQETDFAVELVIGEDGSTDGTRRVVEEYAEKYPGRIRLLDHSRNLGMNANLAATLAACRGEYIALLEGDDFWTDRQKLARQSAFLDQHPECALSFHNVLVISDDAKIASGDYPLQADGTRVMCASGMPSNLSQADLLIRNYIPTCSVVFRKFDDGRLPAWFTKLHLGDHPLAILCTEHGTAAYMPEVMGAYRLHGGSVWSGKSQLHRMARALEMYVELDRHFEGRPQQAILREERMDMLQGYARLLNQHGQAAEAARTAKAYLKLALNTPWFAITHLKSLRRMLALFLRVRFSRPKKP